MSPAEALDRIVNRAKSRVRARVEHLFGVVKRLWGFDKARYRGLATNGTRAFVATALANLFLARKGLADECARMGRKVLRHLGMRAKGPRKRVLKRESRPAIAQHSQ